MRQYTIDNQSREMERRRRQAERAKANKQDRALDKLAKIGQETEGHPFRKLDLDAAYGRWLVVVNGEETMLPKRKAKSLIRTGLATRSPRKVHSLQRLRP